MSASATHLFLNDQLVTITAETNVIKRLNEDDQYLAEYINKAAKMGQFSFLFKDQPVRRIVVRRASPSPAPVPLLKPVWYKKGRPSETDTAATGLLLKLRATEKHQSRLKDLRAGPLRTKVWEEIANEMRVEGYDVDGSKCHQKFLNLVQGYYRYKHFVDSCTCSEQKMYPPEYFTELHRILGDRKTDDSDDEWLPNNMKKRKRNPEDEEEVDETFFKNFLKRNSELKEERFREISDLIKKRNILIKEKIKQNEKIIQLLERFVKD